MEIINSHVHLEDIELLEKMQRTLKDFDISKMCILSYAKGSLINANIIALAAKYLFPTKIFVFGGLDYSGLHSGMRVEAPGLLRKQLEHLIKIGCDGIKLLDLKPTEFIGSPFSLDDQVFEPFFLLAQEEETPCVLHIADPEYFWDPKRVPSWAVREGWFYGDGKYPSREALYQILNNLLQGYPRLKLTLAHFGYLSDQLDYLDELLELYPNLSLDLAPGAEIYVDFSMSIAKTQEFFYKHENRIIFGTDFELGSLKQKEQNFDLDDMVTNMKLVKTFLESNGLIQTPVSVNQKIEGIGLEKNVLENIYHKNFERIVGNMPKPLNQEVFREEMFRVETYLKKMGLPSKCNFAQKTHDFIKHRY